MTVVFSTYQSIAAVSAAQKAMSAKDNVALASINSPLYSQQLWPWRSPAAKSAFREQMSRIRSLK